MKIYYGRSTARKNLIELPSQNLFVGLAWGPGISLIDPDGDIIHTNHYWSDTVLVQQSIRKLAENEFCFVTGYNKDTCSLEGFGVLTRIHPLIGRMDSLGNILAVHQYVLNEGCMNLAEDLEITSSGAVITWGNDFALKADPAGSLIWAKSFNSFIGFQFIKELPGGDLLAGINMDGAGAVVARLDPGGNFLWCKSYIRPKGMVHDCLIESDSSYVIVGYTDSVATTNIVEPLAPSYQPKLFMMQLNALGEVQWCRAYDGEPNFYVRRGLRIEQTLDGDRIVLANIGVQNYNVPLRPFLMKTDVNGDTLWTRSVGATGYRYSTADLLPSSDGGYYYDGSISGNLPGLWTGAPYIFKTDPLGNLPCLNRSHPVQVIDLFPSDSSLTLTASDGAEVLQVFVGDTTFDPLVVYDACSVATAISTVHAEKKLNVHPNPNTGRFTVLFADPLTEESYYSVFDALGRSLYRRPWPAGKATEEVDLARFGKGTYVIKFTAPDGVCYERIVLE